MGETEDVNDESDDESSTRVDQNEPSFSALSRPAPLKAVKQPDPKPK